MVSFFVGLASRLILCCQTGTLMHLVERRYVRSLQALGAFLNGEFNFLAFHEIAVAIGGNGRVVNEYVLSALT